MSLESYNLTAVDLMSTKHGSMSVSVLLIPTIELGTNRLAFLPLQEDSCVTGLPSTTAKRSAWNQLANTGSLFSIS